MIDKIEDVDRFNKKTVLQVIVAGKERTVFERHNKRVNRIKGPAVPREKWIQVKTIFSQDENIISPKPDLLLEEKEKLRVINTRFLTKEEEKRLAILAKNGIKYLEQGWLEIRSWKKINDQYILAPKRVKDIEAAIRMQGHIFKKYKLDTGQEKASDIMLIIPIIALRQEQLKLEISYLEAGKNAALNKVKNLLYRQDSELLARKPDVEKFINKINYILSRFWPSPYYEAGKTCIALLNSAKGFIRAHNLPQTKKYLRAVRHVFSNEI